MTRYDHYTDKFINDDLISREALKTIESIQSADFNSIETIREWIDNAPTVPAIPISVIEQIKAEIAEINTEGHPNGIYVRYKAIDIINHHIKEYKA